MTYAEKLKSPLWQRKRLLILERDKWTCLCCGATDRNLNVHHLVYRKLDPWEYPDELYQTLCFVCHKERQELIDKACDALRIAVKDVPTERLTKLAQSLCDRAMDEMGSNGQ